VSASKNTVFVEDVRVHLQWKCIQLMNWT